MSVAFHNIRDGENTELDTIKFNVQADSGAGIDKIEVYANGVKKEEKNAARIEVEWRLDRGVYQITAKAYSRDGQTQEKTIRVGVGGDKVE